MTHIQNQIASFAQNSDVRKALIYCRVSTTKQTIEGSGLQSQELRCRRYAEDKGYSIEAVFPVMRQAVAIT